MKLGNRKMNKIRVNRDNIQLLQNVTSKSGYTFHELYYVNGNQYVTCLQIFDFMEDSKNGFLNSIINLENTLVTIDFSHLSQSEYEEKFEKILKKHENTQESARKYINFKKARKYQQSMNEFDSYIEATKDSVKYLTLRVYVYDSSLEKLQDRLDLVINRLSTIKLKGYVQTNDLETDVKALTSFSNPVKQMVSSSTIAECLYRSEINVVDDGVCLIGYTANGLYAPNIFSFKNYSYNKAFIGGMGAGKSALVKSVHESMYLRGNHISYIFDIHGEYRDIANQHGISIIGINEDHHINLMQIFYVNAEDGIIRKNDIQTKISTIVATFDSFTGYGRKQTLDFLSILLDEFYEKYENKHLNEIKNEDWLLLEEVLKEAEKKYEEKGSNSEETKDLYNILTGLKKMVHNYGYIFNCKTNMNLDLNQSLVFDISFIQLSDDEKLMASYTSLLLDYVSYGVYLNLLKNERLMREKGVKPYELDMPMQTLEVVIDEFMKYAKDRGFLEKVLAIIKFMRKAYSGFSFVIHATNDTEKDMENNGDLLSQVFELCTNKFIGITEGKSLQTLPKLISGLNENDMRIVSGFRKGEKGERSFFVIDDQKRKIVMTSIVTPYQRKYFGGGV